MTPQSFKEMVETTPLKRWSYVELMTTHLALNTELSSRLKEGASQKQIDEFVWPIEQVGFELMHRLVDKFANPKEREHLDFVDLAIFERLLTMLRDRVIKTNKNLILTKGSKNGTS